MYQLRPTQLFLPSALAAALADSPAHARLAWFTDGVLRYDQIGEHLVVTDAFDQVIYEADGQVQCGA